MEAGTARFRTGAGRICLDFTRTLRYRGRPGETEELPDQVALAAWLRQFGPGLPERLPTPAQLALARRLREAVHEMITAARALSPEGRALPLFQIAGSKLAGSALRK